MALGAEAAIGAEPPDAPRPVGAFTGRVDGLELDLRQHHATVILRNEDEELVAVAIEDSMLNLLEVALATGWDIEVSYELGELRKLTRVKVSRPA